MLWQSGRRSSNVENRRGLPGGGLGGKLGGGAGGMFLIGIVVWALGGNPMGFFMEGAQRAMVQRSAHSTLTPEQENEQADFVSVVLASTEDVWTAQFAQYNALYRYPSLVLFTGYVDSGCGSAQSAMGPFYCPRDEKVYLDLGFFQTMEDELGAPGDFARAYVIAHEIGHHVQTITGAMARWDEQRRTARGRVAANAVSVQTELQADCLAGVWAHDANKKTTMIEPGDIAEALAAAAKIGDDVLQKKEKGHAMPDTFTHGTAAQRQAAFHRGFEGGTLDICGIR